MLADLCEVVMLVCFGLSWPINIRKAWIGRTARGTSAVFYAFILIGYLFGIAGKLIKYNNGISTPWYVWFFYILNSLMVTAGILIWVRNKGLDALEAHREKKAQKAASAAAANQAQAAATASTQAQPAAAETAAPSEPA